MSPNYYQGPLEDLFKNNTPLIDVRSPCEFEKGAFPKATNIPILSDEQRHNIGICYKNEGQEKAIELGHQQVSGNDKKNKIESWQKHIEEKPDSVLYCFRGGLRSQISQDWIMHTGKDIPIIEGGYKRLRNYLIESLEAQVEKNKFYIISGNTGSGKTNFLHKLKEMGENVIDLEGHANHRGSAFGPNQTPQPSQIDFENSLSIEFLRKIKNASYFFVEDESPCVGRLKIPKVLFDKMRNAPILFLEVNFDKRVEYILDDYVIRTWTHLKLESNPNNQNNPNERLYQYYKIPFDKIEKRLGQKLHKECLEDLKQACQELEKSGSFDLHKSWIAKLLKYYYDPLYEKGLAKKMASVVYRGNESQIINWFQKKII